MLPNSSAKGICQRYLIGPENSTIGIITAKIGLKIYKSDVEIYFRDEGMLMVY